MGKFLSNKSSGQTEYDSRTVVLCQLLPVLRKTCKEENTKNGGYNSCYNEWIACFLYNFFL